MLIGPAFSREVAATSRSWRLYFVRALYVAALFSLVATAWLILTGSQQLRTLGELARFGAASFALVAPVQLSLAVAFSALLSAAAVAQEKDRRTFELLLLTRMSNSELVLGKLLASMLTVLVLIVAGIPLLALLTLLGGVSEGQVARVLGVTLTAALVAGSLGSTIALWREKTFQSLAVTVLALVLWLIAGEIVARGVLGDPVLNSPAVRLAEGISPARAILAAARPGSVELSAGSDLSFARDSVRLFMVVSLAAAAALNLLSIACVRIWNPTRELRSASGPENSENLSPTADGTSVHAAPGRARQVWDNPVLWREVCTWAYGRKLIIIRLAYLAVFVACAWGAWSTMAGDTLDRDDQPLPPSAQALVPLLALGLVMVNALAVTSLTNERDAKALDLLLVTDLTPKEIIFGKLGGVLFNSKEMIAAPLLLSAAMWWQGWLSGENLMLLVASLLALTAFVAMLGIHVGMTYANSRTAVAVSLGTLLFLLLGIAVCMRMMVAFQDDFNSQLQAFMAFMFGGGVGLYCALGARNPSNAITTASGLAPWATFYVITSFLQGNYGAAAMVTVAMYAFATAALLVPAVYEFDVATGRTTAKDA
ncbi:MAG TPA: hypothetical protein PKC18_02930 [Lacipirellulaceae bacterium]|nr:hypothetical protein [Lacipirellulaceae bacterium]